MCFFADTIIRNCCNAHILCSSCMPNIDDTCPVCRLKTKKFRNRIAERIIQELNFETEIDCCRYCNQLLTRERLKVHEIICAEKQVFCPLSVINGLMPRRCRKISQKIGITRRHFELCCPDKVYPCMPNVFLDYYSHFLLNTVIECDYTIRFATRRYTLFHEELFVYRPIRVINPFFSYFMGHTYLYRCIKDNEVMHYFGICLSLEEGLCNEIKIGDCVFDSLLKEVLGLFKLERLSPKRKSLL